MIDDWTFAVPTGVHIALAELEAILLDNVAEVLLDHRNVLPDVRMQHIYMLVKLRSTCAVIVSCRRQPTHRHSGDSVTPT